jgi:hypothetical protein
MNVPKSRIVNLFILLGCSKAALWDNEVLAGRIESLPELFVPEMVIRNGEYPEYQELFKHIYDLTKAGQRVTVYDDSNAPVVQLIPSIDRNLTMKTEVETAKEQVDNNSTSNSIENSSETNVQIENGTKSKKTKQSKSNVKFNDVFDSVVANIDKVDSIIDEAVEQVERRKKSRRKAVKQDGTGEVKVPKYKSIAKVLLERQQQKVDWSDVMSVYGSFKWSIRYQIDLFFAAGNSGTLEEVATVSKVSILQAKRHLLELIRTGVVVYDVEQKVFRGATREERIRYIDEGAPKIFKPFCPVADRAWKLQRQQ